jgi:hypothetical protein
MSVITEHWRRYFDEKDEGLGTTYERFVLHDYFERLRQAYPIGRVLEVPSFGMTGISGINSIWWAFQGARVTVADHDGQRLALAAGAWREAGAGADFVQTAEGYTALPFRDGASDLTWCFAALSLVADAGLFAAELARVTSRVIFICVPNDRAALGAIPGCPGGNLPGLMAPLGWRLEWQGYLDAPPWPDIAMKREDFLRKLGLARLAGRMERKDGERLCVLDFWNGAAPDLEQRVRRWAIFEGLPDMVKRLWAHHRYFVFTPRGGRR